VAPAENSLRRVLVIDDDPDIRHITHVALARMGGMEVIEAGGALEGLRLAEQELPDAILLDVMMPGLDGTAALKMLRENPKTVAIPVVFLTARLSELDEDRVTFLGAQGLVKKPFDPTTLAERLRELVGRAVAPTGE
jgi:DNA-binding response OmpR family regulator